jgi:hypothetical protein
MQPSYRPYLIGFFLGVIFVVPLAQAVIEMYSGERLRFADLFTQKPTAQNLRSFEREMERSSVLGKAVRPWVQYVWFAGLGQPGEKAVCGLDGWLFYKPDVRYLVEPYEPGGHATHDDPVAAIVAFRDGLARRGVRLMVVPMPGKPSVYPEKLTRRAGARGGLPLSHTLNLIGRLRRAGVETVDLFEVFAGWRNGGNAEPLYLARDTHWSGNTARRVAEEVAGRIRALGWLAPGSTEYVTRTVPIERRGDVVRMMDAPRIEAGYAPERVVCEQVLAKDGGQRYKDDPGSAVLVLGDSFLRMYETDQPVSAGFIAHLARELHRPVASIVNDGGASTLVRQQLSRRPELLIGKKLVVWEFVERDIRFGTDGWQQVPVP